MDIKEYISSDILDRYVLDTVSEQEKKEVECMSHIYPEIKVALDELQESMNSYVSSYKKEPPAVLKERVMTKIITLNKENKSNPKIINLPDTNNNTSSSSKTYKWLAAASVLLFILTAFLYADIRSKLYTSQNETLVLADQLQQISESSAKKISDLTSKNELIAGNLAMFNNPENKIIKMAGTEKRASAAHATICWNTKTKEVYVGFSNLPQAPIGKQYQLWAIADGKPVDLGVIDKTTDTASMQKMKVTEKAQAFAVTLEKSGGNPSPTLDEMYALGSTN